MVIDVMDKNKARRGTRSSWSRGMCVDFKSDVWEGPRERVTFVSLRTQRK